MIEHNSAPMVVRGGVVVDAAGERPLEILIEDGVIRAVQDKIEPPHGAVVIDASDCYVAPGLVDLHTHLREPGAEHAETIETGTRAAALGGYVAVVAMPNTTPAIDNASMVRDVTDLARGVMTHVAVAGAITVGRAGQQLAPLAEMAELGVRLFTDDGSGVQDPLLMRHALEYASDLGIVLAQHCEDASLAFGGHMHEGAWSSRLGVPGQPSLAEELMLARDLALVALTGAPMHFLHLSSSGSVALIRQAKKDGLPVTAEVTPHHLSLSDARLAGFDPNFKVNPPLRTKDDRAELQTGLGDGTIDAIATDHAPHSTEAKEAPLTEAPPGMLGLETALSVAYTFLVKSEVPTLGVVDLIGAMSWRPAKIAGLERQGFGAPIAPGAPAHLCVFDPTAQWTVDPNILASKSRNTPFAEMRLTGKVRHTVFCGALTVSDGQALR